MGISGTISQELQSQFQTKFIHNIICDAPHVTVWKSAKSDYNHTYFTHITIMNSMWFFLFAVYQWITSEAIGAKHCTKSAFTVYHLMCKNYENLNITFQAPGYRICERNADDWLFTKSIAQSGRYITAIQRKSLSDNKVLLCQKWIKLDKYNI